MGLVTAGLMAGHSQEGFVVCVRFALGCVTCGHLHGQVPALPESGLTPKEPRTLGTLLGCLADAGGPPRAGNHMSKRVCPQAHVVLAFACASRCHPCKAGVR